MHLVNGNALLNRIKAHGKIVQHLKSHLGKLTEVFVADNMALRRSIRSDYMHEYIAWIMAIRRACD